MRKILMMAAYILLTLQCAGVYAGGKLRWSMEPKIW